jgi:hypothetical protein
MTSLRPKKLSFDEMWKLYKVLESGFPEEESEYLISEVYGMLGKLNDSNFKSSLRMMYGDNFHTNLNPSEFVVLFVRGVKENRLFNFASTIKGIRS